MGLFVTSGPPTPSIATTSPTPSTGTPPGVARAIAMDLSSRDCSIVDQVLWVRKG